jgi:hypothetical protein
VVGPKPPPKRRASARTRVVALGAAVVLAFLAGLVVGHALDSDPTPAAPRTSLAAVTVVTVTETAAEVTRTVLTGP